MGLTCFLGWDMRQIKTMSTTGFYNLQNENSIPSWHLENDGCRIS